MVKHVVLNASLCSVKIDIRITTKNCTCEGYNFENVRRRKKSRNILLVTLVVVYNEKIRLFLQKKKMAAKLTQNKHGKWRHPVAVFFIVSHSQQLLMNGKVAPQGEIYDFNKS